MNSDGSNQRRLSSLDQVLWGPSWSADASKIAFTAFDALDGDARDYYEIYTMDADGTNQTRLTQNEDIVDWQPAWSPVP